LDFFIQALKALGSTPAPFKLAGIAILGYFFVIWKTASKSKLLDVIEGVLHKKLSEGYVYRFLRLSVFALLLFSLVLFALAFVAPNLGQFLEIKKIEAEKAYAIKVFESVEAVEESEAAKAKRLFQHGDYSASRGLFTKLLPQASEEGSAEYINGMITATYTGQHLYREGLQFICDLYSSRARGDRRYRFDVQAHLRGISRTEGVKAAESVAQEMRSRCRRPDFSEFWASVKLGLMENLHRGALSDDTEIRLDSKDASRLRYWLKRKQHESGRKQVDFGDYALYFLGEYEEALTQYPKSDIRDVLLQEAAYKAKWPKDAMYFEQFVQEYPNAQNLKDIYRHLAMEYDEHGVEPKTHEYLNKYVAKLDSDEREMATGFITEKDYLAAKKLAASGDFDSARKAAINGCARARSYQLGCGEFDALVARLNPIIKASSLSRADKCRQIFFRAREHKILMGARAFLDRCLDNLASNRLEYGKALYLLASSSKRLGEYDRAIQYLDRFVREIHDHPLLDDAYAEIGWYYVVISPNWQKAKYNLEKVVHDFPDRNAYDDALWWLAQAAKWRGKYAEAVNYYGKIIAFAARSRFRLLAAGQMDQVAAFNDNAPLDGVVLAESYTHGNEIAVRSVRKESPAAQLRLRPGDVITNICNSPLYKVDDVFEAASQMRKQKNGNWQYGIVANSNCNVVYRRGDRVLTFSGSGPNPADWQLTVSKEPPL
jgi:tetratricopeptide (TPR) repeat protein